MCQCDCPTCRNDIRLLKTAIGHLNERLSTLENTSLFSKPPTGTRAAAISAPGIGVKHVDPFDPKLGS